ncbi:MAG: 2-oxoacid:acceptor oxidoreductase family protein [Nitrospinota bacterium]
MSLLRIRLHGRGGQGIKTASQILGSAAFLSGYQAQDFPLYGAERRGAPIVAFARISKAPILERGPIVIPDLLLIGDETLLDSPQAAPLCGADDSTIVFLNSSKKPDQIQSQYSLSKLPFQLNLRELCIQFLNHEMLLSSALAAVGARLTGLIDLESLLEAVDIEFKNQGIPSIQENIELAKTVFQKLTTAKFPHREESELVSSQGIELKQYTVTDSAPLIFAPGNMAMRKTGDWRVNRPEIDYTHCNKCLICYARCPDGAINLGPEDQPEIDYDHCKGCLICAQECPGHFIKTVREAGTDQ